MNKSLGCFIGKKQFGWHLETPSVVPYAHNNGMTLMAMMIMVMTAVMMMMIVMGDHKKLNRNICSLPWENIH